MEVNQDYSSLKRLRREVLLWSIPGMIGLAVCIIWFFWDLSPDNLLKSTAFMLILSFYLLITLWKDLSLNRSAAYGMLYPDLGLANSVTLMRGWLLIFLAGFMFYPVEGVRYEWVPGILFLTISILDFSDGAIARLSGRTTLLGEQLDMRLDGAGMLFASIILVATGRAPLFFILAGAVRYLYLLGHWILKKVGKPIHPLTPNAYRRALAGMMMGYISATLFPVFSPVVTNVTATIFLIPFLIGFGQDWLLTSGVLSNKNQIRRPEGPVFDLVYLFLRIAAGCALIFSPVFPTEPSNFPGFMFSLLTIMGILPRVNVLGILVYTATLLHLHYTDPMLWAALVLSCISFFLGAGNLALWAPEDRLIFHRVGESPE